MFPTGLRETILRNFGKKVTTTRALVEVTLMASPLATEALYVSLSESPQGALSLLYHVLNVILFLQNVCFFGRHVVHRHDRSKLLTSIDKINKVFGIESLRFDLVLVMILLNFATNGVLRYSVQKAWNDAFATLFVQLLLLISLYSTLNVFVPFLAIMVTLEQSLKVLHGKLGTSDVVLLDKMYDEVTSCLKIVSRIFGPSLLLLHLSTFVNVVALSVWICKHCQLQSGCLWYGGIDITLIVYLADITLLMLVICSISNTSGGIKDKIREASLTVFEMILSCPEELREDLTLLNEALVSRKVRMTAAGFFEIDNSIMVSFVGSVWYYVVVFVQLK